WIRLHTNAKAHRKAALTVLGAVSDRDALRERVRHWDCDELEAAVVAAGGCAATMRTPAAWLEHPQGQAVAAEPLVHWHSRPLTGPGAATRPHPPERPLQGIRILDLTRVLAGPVAGRFLAGFGAEVLRIDPPGWDEPGVIPEVTLGKRCARLDLHTQPGREALLSLLAGADVLLHGYRPGALAALGLGEQVRHACNPDLIDVGLDAYGWNGPWAGRRGFDSLVQMSSGIAALGMALAGTEIPRPLPVQALDHATGYLLAAAVLQGLRQRAQQGQVLQARLSLARMARLLLSAGHDNQPEALAPETAADLAPWIEQTAWGPAQRVHFPLTLAGCEVHWDYPASRLGSSVAQWSVQVPASRV
ncbi:MAG TPA: CoA transferase, partial [Thiolinea sp.]|nr:CoA transferase [Thiolinea sp.]